jgi:hypothetical protein
LGSIRVVVDEAGNIVSSDDYDPLGYDINMAEVLMVLTLILSTSLPAKKEMLKPATITLVRGIMTAGLEDGML